LSRPREDNVTQLSLHVATIPGSATEDTSNDAGLLLPDCLTIGREGSKYGIEDCIEIKYLCMGGI
jgi:hypothetical protein